MGRLRLEDSVQETIVAYAGGNPGALTFLIELIKIKDNDFFVDFMTIDKERVCMGVCGCVCVCVCVCVYFGDIEM